MKYPMGKQVVNWSVFLAVLAVCFLGGEWMIRVLPVSARMADLFVMPSTKP